MMTPEMVFKLWRTFGWNVEPDCVPSLPAETFDPPSSEVDTKANRYANPVRLNLAHGVTDPTHATAFCLSPEPGEIKAERSDER